MRRRRVHVKHSSGEKRPVDGFQWREAPDDGRLYVMLKFFIRPPQVKPSLLGEGGTKRRVIGRECENVA